MDCYDCRRDTAHYIRIRDDRPGRGSIGRCISGRGGGVTYGSLTVAVASSEQENRHCERKDYANGKGQMRSISCDSFDFHHPSLIYFILPLSQTSVCGI